MLFSNYSLINLTGKFGIFKITVRAELTLYDNLVTNNVFFLIHSWKHISCSRLLASIFVSLIWINLSTWKYILFICLSYQKKT